MRYDRAKVTRHGRPKPLPALPTWERNPMSQPSGEPTGQPNPGGTTDPLAKPPTEDPAPTGQPGTDGADDGEGKWKTLSRKHETEAARERKERERLEKRLAELEKANMSESEKAVAEARTEGEKTAAAKFANRLALAEFKAAAATSGIDFDEIEDLINVSAFVGESGEIDSDAIRKRVGKLAKSFGTAAGDKADGKTSGGAPRSGPDSVNGSGGNAKVTREDVEKLAVTSPEKVAELYAKGQLSHLV